MIWNNSKYTTQNSYPDFLCIGAKKSATTWLFWVLEHHPDIWIPPVKEIHYFNDDSSSSIINRFLRNNNKNFIKNYLIKRVLRNLLIHKDLKNTLWYYRLIFKKRDDKYYFTLFRKNNDNLCGDITPDYAIINDESVRKIQNIMPNVKIIYIIRNPIDRIWSHISMKREKKGQSDILKTDAVTVKKLIDSKTTSRHSMYEKNLNIWERIFHKQQMYIGFYDQLLENPSAFIEDICRFLNISFPDSIVKLNLNKRINASNSSDIPDDLHNYLFDKYSGELEYLNNRFKNKYTQQWLDYAEYHLN